jgi:hypothetical protein
MIRAYTGVLLNRYAMLAVAVLLFLFLLFRSVWFSCSFVNVLARKQYKYARKLGSTVVNCPAKPSAQ